MGLVRCGDTERYRNIAHYAQYTGYSNLCIRCLRNGIDVERCAYKAVTGAEMCIRDSLMSNIYVVPRGMQRAGYNKGNTVNWTAKYGSVIAAGYDIGTCDGMNEKGLVASLLFLPESIYHRPGDNRPITVSYTQLLRACR